MAEKQHYEQVEDLLRGWNAPPSDHSLERLVGAPVPEGDTRATASVTPPGSVAESPYDDDGGDEYDELDIAGLRAEADKRNEGRDEDSRISKGGSADDIRARLREDDAANEDGDDEG